MTTTELNAARAETADEIGACLQRLGRAADFLTLAQRLLLAELARDVADRFDRGKQVFQPHTKTRGRLIATNCRDAQGRRLFRVE